MRQGSAVDSGMPCCEGCLPVAAAVTARTEWERALRADSDACSHTAVPGLCCTPSVPKGPGPSSFFSASCTRGVRGVATPNKAERAERLPVVFERTKRTERLALSFTGDGGGMSSTGGVFGRN